MKRFDDKVVAVTGGAGGIGRALCARFAAEGARVAVVDRDEAAAREAAGEIAGAMAVALDVADADGVAAGFGDVDATLGPVDILVNNAGFVLKPTLATMTPDDWQAEVQGNLGGAYHCARVVIPGMQTRRSGCIVNISSVNGLQVLGHPAYSAAKAGLINFTKSLAVEYGPDGIRANAVCPGTVATPVWSERAARRPEVFERLKQWYPLGRIVEREDVAKAVAFLASDDASAITGAVLPVDCGLSAGNRVMASELTLEEY